MCGSGELYPVLFWIFGIVFNFAKPLSRLLSKILCERPLVSPYSPSI